jgi:hypothetical protein
MDTFTQLSQSMNTLSLFMEYAFAFVGTLCAIAAGAWIAFKLSPVDPSESSVAKSHERYADFQARWAMVRARRRDIMSQLASSDLETRRTDRKRIEADQTDPDLSVADMFWRERIEALRDTPAVACSPAVCKTDAVKAVTEKAVGGVKVSRVFIAATLLMCLSLFGCSAIVNPDSGRLFGDSGEVMGDAGPMIDSDAGTPDAWVNPSEDAGVDSGTVSAGDAGATCASLPLGDVTLDVVSTNCEGPFALIQSFSGRVRDLGASCAVNMTTSEEIRRRMAEDPAYAQKMQRELHQKLMYVPWHTGVQLTPEEIQVAIFVCRYFDSFGPQK